MFVLVVGPESSRHEQVVAALASLNCHCVLSRAENMRSVVQQHGTPEVVVLLPIDAEANSELDCLRILRGTCTSCRTLFIANRSSEELAIAALHAGADRYLKESWTADTLRTTISDLLPCDLPAASGKGSLLGGDRIIGRSQAMRDLRDHLVCVASTNSSVLITGDTGTGKELVAELIHANSPRSNKPFICINTAAMPETLAESELFGHERGAFTGAATAQEGKLTAANSGTIFLDEIGDVPLTVQAKLLRALENKTVYRVGATRATRLDVRIIAATHQDLERATTQGQFRKDLYYRLNVIRVRLPSLRERIDDIPLLVQHFVRHFNRELGRSVRGVSSRGIDVLCSYDWPGNIRELRNVMEAMMVNISPETSGLVELPRAVLHQLAAFASAPTSERERLLQALTATNWNKSKAASQLRCSRMTLYRKMHQHELSLRK